MDWLSRRYHIPGRQYNGGGMIDPLTETTGLVLAGGESRRMGGLDKGLVTLADRPMVRFVLDRLAPQVASILINANRNLDLYAAEGHAVVPDIVDGYLGPLAGMASGLKAAKTEYVLCVPCDCPLLPQDLAQRMATALMTADAELAVASDGDRLHPVFTLLKRAALPSILAFLDEGERKIDKWFARHTLAVADFSDQPESFLNVNRPEERARLERQLAGGGDD